MKIKAPNRNKEYSWVTPKTIIALVATVIISLQSWSQGEEAAENEDGSNSSYINNIPEFHYGSLVAAIRTARMGDNKRTHIWKVGGESNVDKYFFEPALLPRWENYIPSVKDVCGSIETASITDTKKLKNKGQNYRVWTRLIELGDTEDFVYKNTLSPFTTTTERFNSEFSRNSISIKSLMRVNADSIKSYINTPIEAGVGLSEVNKMRTQAWDGAKNDDHVNKFGIVPKFNMAATDYLSKIDAFAPTLSLPVSPKDADKLHKTRSEKISIPLLIVLDDDTYRSQLLSSLTAIDPAGQPKDHNLFPIPYDLTRLILNATGKKYLLWSSDLSHLENFSEITPGYTRAESFALDRVIRTNIDASCEEHLQIVAEIGSGNANLVGQIYRTGTQFDVTALYLATTIRMSEELQLQLNTEENTKIKFTSEGGSAGLSLNLGPIGYSGGGSSASTEQEASRFVSRDIFNSAIKSAIAKTDVSCTGKCEKLTTDLLGKIYDQEKGVFYLIKDTLNNNFGLLSDQLGYFTIADSELSGDIEKQLKTINQQIKEGKVALGEGFEVSGQDDSKIEVDDRINTKLGANKIPVAVTGDLAFISKEDIEYIIQANIYQRLPTDGESRLYFEFLYPSYDFSIGNIDDYDTANQKLEKLKEAAALKLECETSVLGSDEPGNLGIPRMVSDSKVSIRRHKPSTHTDPVIASARAGFFIDAKSVKAADTGEYSDGFRLLNRRVFHPQNVLDNNSQNQMLQSVSYVGTCSRAKSYRHKKTCIASGYITFTELPLKCAPHIVENYGK